MRMNSIYARCAKCERDNVEFQSQEGDCVTTYSLDDVRSIPTEILQDIKDKEAWCKCGSIITLDVCTISTVRVKCSY
jgi:hypothetical protein